MKRTTVLAIIGGLLAASVAAGPAAAQAREETVSRFIVKLRDTGALTAQAETPARLGRVAAAAASRGIALSPLRTMALGAHVMAMDRTLGRADAEALAAELAQNPDVEYVQPDYRRHPSRTPSDPRFLSQWYLAASSNGIDAVDAWDVTTGSPSVVVAVVDTGYLPHSDLAGRILPGYDFISDPRFANDGNGRDADASDPGDWVSAADLADPAFRDCTIEDSTWHGTGVAGVIAADSDNSRFVTGIDWTAKIVPVRVLGKCGGDDSDILDGIAWAAGLVVPGVPANPYPAQVINVSLGGGGACPAAYHSILSAALAHGVTRAIVAAAGNDGGDVSANAPSNCSETIAVAATTRLGNLASYSNSGAGIAVSAPGGELSATSAVEGITILWNSGTTGPGADDWAKGAGTSLATPMVSGVASLALAVAPSLSAAQLRTLLTSTASPFPAGSNCTQANCGAGIVNARAAVVAAQAGPAAANYQGMWWAGSAEDGWGINFAHQGNVIFGTWFTYDTTGKNSWMTLITDSNPSPGVFTAKLYATTGPPFNSQPFVKTGPPASPVGSATLNFSDVNNGSFHYDVTLPTGTVSQTKAITRQPLGAAPFATCTSGGQPLAAATNYQDMWWAGTSASPKAEDGWGINFAQQGDVIFASWFTYDLDGAPLWLVTTLVNLAPGVYKSADLYRPSGPRFDAYSTSLYRANASVGSMLVSFADGNNATFSYSVQLPGMAAPAQQSKPITRQLFSAAGTTCQ